MSLRRLIVLLLSCCAVNAWGESIRVRLLAEQQHLQLQLEQGLVSWCPQPGVCEHLGSQSQVQLRWLAPGRAVLGLRKVDSAQIFLSAFSVRDARGRAYPGRLRLWLGERGVDVIAEMDLEEYLIGVLPSEMPAAWPRESLKAQAVASRSYVLYQMLQAKAKGASFDVEATTMDQVYRKDAVSSAWQKKIAKVLASTRGEILTHKQRPMKAFFHSHCGGHTEMAGNVWPGAEAILPVADPFCSDTTHSRRNLSWQHQLSFQQIEQEFRRQHPSKDVKIQGTLIGLRAGNQNLSGRVERVHLFFSNSQVHTWSAVDFRKSFGYDLIKSTRFHIQARDKGVSITGNGYGHGVGLGQHGAKSMAQRGINYRQILAHYYPQTPLVVWTPSKKSSEALAQTDAVKNRSGKWPFQKL